jgi:hypothetical protein
MHCQLYAMNCSQNQRTHSLGPCSHMLAVPASLARVCCALQSNHVLRHRHAPSIHSCSKHTSRLVLHVRVLQLARFP